MICFVPPYNVSTILLPLLSTPPPSPSPLTPHVVQRHQLTPPPPCTGLYMLNACSSHTHPHTFFLISSALKGLSLLIARNNFLECRAWLTPRTSAQSLASSASKNSPSTAASSNALSERTVRRDSTRVQYATLCT